MSLYILKFEPQFRHAKYYLGWCRDGTFKKRLGMHLTGRGAKIVKRAIEAGIDIIPVLVVAGTRADEKRYKSWCNNGRVLKRLEKKGAK